MIFLTSWGKLTTRTWLQFRFLISSPLEARIFAANSIVNGSFCKRPFCHEVGERVAVVNSVNSIWPFVNNKLPNMEITEGVSVQPVVTDNAEGSSKGTEDVEFIDTTNCKEVTDVNQKDSPVNQNSFSTGSFTQEQVSSFSNSEMESAQHSSEDSCTLAAESDEVTGESPNLFSPELVNSEGDFVSGEFSHDATVETESSQSFHIVRDEQDSDLNGDDDSLGLNTLFDEGLQCTNLASSQSVAQGRPKPRQRKLKKRDFNEQGLHCDDESLGLENLFNEDLQQRDAARWATQNKLKSSTQRKRDKRKRKRKLSSLSDDNEDTDLASTSANKDDSTSSKPKKKPKKIMPNHFVAMRVANPQIHSGVKIVQDSIITHNEKLKPALVPLATLHLTLLVVHLEDDEQIQKATDILHLCRASLEPFMQNSTLTLNFSGLDHFRHQVLFVKLCGEERIATLNSVANIVRETFTKEGIPSTDSRDFNPHLTVMKLTRSPKLRKKGVKKIPVESYTSWVDFSFGEETVSTLHLCSMNTKDKDGFYKCLATVQFESGNEQDSESAPEPECNVKALESNVGDIGKKHQEAITSSLHGETETFTVGDNIKDREFQMSDEDDSCVINEEDSCVVDDDSHISD